MSATIHVKATFELDIPLGSFSEGENIAHLRVLAVREAKDAIGRLMEGAVQHRLGVLHLLNIGEPIIKLKQLNDDEKKQTENDRVL